MSVITVPLLFKLQFLSLPIQQCRFCLQSNPLSCMPAGPPDGPGVSGADFVLYVSAVDTARCRNEDTIAYAAHCQQEAELDRYNIPITEFIAAFFRCTDYGSLEGIVCEREREASDWKYRMEHRPTTVA